MTSEDSVRYSDSTIWYVTSLTDKQTSSRSTEVKNSKQALEPPISRPDLTPGCRQITEYIIISDSSPSGLTSRAVKCGPLGNYPPFDCGRALQAFFTLAPIDGQGLHEVSRCSVRSDKVLESRTSLLDRLRQDSADSLCQYPVTAQRYFPALANRADSSQEQRLTDVDIAHPDDNPAVHQE